MATTDVYNAEGERIEFNIPEDATDIIFYGEANGFNTCSYVDNQQTVHIIAGCRNFDVLQGLKHWEGRPERNEIYAICEMLEKIAASRRWNLGKEGPAVIPTDFKAIADLKVLFVDEGLEDESEFGQAFLKLLSLARSPEEKEPKEPLATAFRRRQ